MKIVQAVDDGGAQASGVWFTPAKEMDDDDDPVDQALSALYDLADPELVIQACQTLGDWINSQEDSYGASVYLGRHSIYEHLLRAMDAFRGDRNVILATSRTLRQYIVPFSDDVAKYVRRNICKFIGDFLLFWATNRKDVDVSNELCQLIIALARGSEQQAKALINAPNVLARFKNSFELFDKEVARIRDTTRYHMDYLLSSNTPFAVVQFVNYENGKSLPLVTQGILALRELATDPRIRKQLTIEGSAYTVLKGVVHMYPSIEGKKWVTEFANLLQL
jgi:hypothetical protein